jgi:hypothetical protein
MSVGSNPSRAILFLIPSSFKYITDLLLLVVVVVVVMVVVFFLGRALNLSGMTPKIRTVAMFSIVDLETVSG